MRTNKPLVTEEVSNLLNALYISSTQLQRRRPDRRHPDNQRKAEFFETLHQFRPTIFPAGCLRAYRNRTEALRAVANRDLLRLLAGREERDARRFDKARKRSLS